MIKTTGEIIDWSEERERTGDDFNIKWITLEKYEEKIKTLFKSKEVGGV